MLAKRGSTNWYLLIIFLTVLVVFVLTIIFFSSNNQEIIISEDASFNQIPISLVSSQSAVIEVNSAIISAKGNIVIHPVGEAFKIEYRVEQCPNLALNYTASMANKTRSYNPLRQRPFLRDDGEIGLRALSIEDRESALVLEKVYSIEALSQEEILFESSNLSAEFFVTQNDLPLTINFDSRCPAARVLVSLFEVIQ